MNNYLKRVVKKKKKEVNVRLKKKTQYMTPSMFSISMSVLRRSHDFLMVDLVPLRHINADLRSANEVLARIHEIVLA